MSNPLVDTAIDGLRLIGVPIPPSMSALIELLIDIGEDVLTAVPKFIDIINHFGAEVWHVLEEVSSGIARYGIIGYTERQLVKLFEPHLQTVQNVHDSKTTLITHHRQTLATLDLKLKTLSPTASTTTTTSTMTFQGNAASAMHTSYDNISLTLNNHINALENSQQYDKDLIDAIHKTSLIGVGIMAATILAFGVVALILSPTGVGSVAAIGVCVEVLEIEAAVILGTMIGEFLWWETQHGNLVLPTVQDPSYTPPQTTDPNTDPQDSNQNNDDDANKFNKKLNDAVNIALGAAILSKLIRDLTDDEKEKLIRTIGDNTGCDDASIRALLEKYPNLSVATILQILTVQRTIKMNEKLQEELQNKLSDPNYKDPEIQKSMNTMSNKAKKDIRSLQQLEQTLVDNNGMQNADFQKTMIGSFNSFKGNWTEWKLAEYYGDQGNLLFFGRHMGNTDIDVAIRDGNNIRFIQLKNYEKPFSINNPNSTSGFSNDYRNLLKQAGETNNLANSPNIKQDMVKQYKYKWFDPKNGKIEVEYDFSSRQPGQSWKPVTDGLHNAYPDILIHTTDTNDPTRNPGNPGFDPNNPFNDPNFGDKLNNMPPLDNNWCAPINLPDKNKPKPTPTVV